MSEKILTKHIQTVYRIQRGPTDVAVVEHGVCIESWVNPPLGTVWQNNNPNYNLYRGLTVPELKAAGFTYTRNQTKYYDAQGVEYSYSSEEPGWLYCDNEEGGWHEIPAGMQITIAAANGGDDARE